VKPSRLFLILLLTLSSGLASGCLERQVYLQPGQTAEIARPVAISVWIKNAETGKRELRVYNAQSGDAVGRRK
jgi:hypothetical protein